MALITRRNFLFYAVASALPQVARAGGGGGDAAERKKKKPTDSTPKRRVTRLFSTDLQRMSRRQIMEYEHLAYKNQVTVDGFSSNMVKNLFLALRIDKRRTQRLIRQMSKLKKPRDRRARLLREKDLVYKELQKSDAPKLYKNYIEVLDAWARAPHEGL